MKLLTAFALILAVLSLNFASASVIREEHGSAQDYYIRVTTKGERVFFKKCAIVSKQCRFLGSAAGFKMSDLEAKRISLKRNGWADVATFGTVTVVIGGLATVLSAGTTLPAIGVALTAAGGAGSAALMAKISPELAQASVIEKEYLRSEKVFEVQDLDSFTKDLFSALK